MTARHNARILAARDEVVPSPTSRACEDHNWGLPNGVYAAMVVLFAGAIAVLALAFRANMAVSYGAIFFFLAAFFLIPTVFVRTSRKRGGGTRPLGWSVFSQEGIATATGQTSASEATTLVLVLPFLMLCWAIAIAVIAALV